MAITGETARPGFVSEAPKLGFIGGFDGIRGIGIIMVLSQHLYSNLYPSAAGIVDMFFVMSAFLIVSLLMQEHRQTHGINFRKFYSRRAVRLLPTAYLCVVAWFVASLIFDPERIQWLYKEALAAFFYIYEFVFPVGIGAVAPETAEHLSLSQYWSLAVEEQFYLLIGITVLVAIRRNWMKQLAWLMVGGAVLIGWQRWIGHTGPWPFNEPTDSSVPARGLSLLWLSRPDALMWGVALAVLNAYLPELTPRMKKWLPTAAAISLFIFFFTMLLASPFFHEVFQKFPLLNKIPFTPMQPRIDENGVVGGGTFWIQYGHTVCAITFMLPLLVMARMKDWWINRWLSWQPLRWLGRQSYTLYVWHTLFFWLILDVAGFDDVLGEKTRVLILVPLGILMGVPIYYGVEQRMMKVKLRFSSEKEVLDLTTGKMVSVEEASGGRVTAASLDAERAVSAGDVAKGGLSEAGRAERGLGEDELSGITGESGDGKQGET
jgi:peptidoglycan/LPS O-acetylase OafA/YrhL